jgi:radical SAM protein with 4Fe4S-binding SPASM domain
MSGLIQRANQTAAALGLPLSVQVDLTWRCNERCVHCYLDHDDLGELTTAEVKDLLDQLAAAGVFFLSFSGGEILLRKDLFEILEHARRLAFDIKLRTNALLIRAEEARRIGELDVRQVQVSVYSHRADIHDGITKVRGSLDRTVESIRRLRAEGLKVIVACVLMRQNREDYPGVQALAATLGAQFSIDPTITPHINGDRSLLALNVERADLLRVFHDTSIAGENAAGFTAPPPVDEASLEASPCSAGHTACYVSPYGDVYPCVQFPLPSGNVRRQRFLDIWRDSPQLEEVRQIRVRDLPSCSACVHGGSCSRCPGLAYMEGDVRGPSTADCEKSYARTGIASLNLRHKAAMGIPQSQPGLVQISSRPA